MPRRFAVWVNNRHIDSGVNVRRLPKILGSAEATRLLEVIGFNAAVEYLEKNNPSEQQLYSIVENLRSRLKSIDVTELLELGESVERQAILRSLQKQIDNVLELASRRMVP